MQKCCAVCVHRYYSASYLKTKETQKCLPKDLEGVESSAEANFLSSLGLFAALGRLAFATVNDVGDGARLEALLNAVGVAVPLAF